MLGIRRKRIRRWRGTWRSAIEVTVANTVSARSVPSRSVPARISREEEDGVFRVVVVCKFTSDCVRFHIAYHFHLAPEMKN